MTEVCAIDADTLAVGQDADVIPVDLAVAERRPAVHPRLLDKVAPGAVARAIEERLASIRIVECDLAGGFGLLLQKGRGTLPVAAILRVCGRRIRIASSEGVEGQQQGPAHAQ